MFNGLSLEETRAMPIVQAMKASAPLTEDVVQVPVGFPTRLYLRSFDWEHDDCVEAAVHILMGLHYLVLGMFPREGHEEIWAASESALRALEDWEETNAPNSVYSPKVTVSIPIPCELMSGGWGHWLSVSIGRYAGECICAQADALSDCLNVPPLTETLITEWKRYIDSL